MRSARPMPGNPWPHDMSITVEDSNDALLTLLWVREAWGLEVRGDDLPPLLVETPERVDEAARAAAPIAEWTHYWPELWASALEHAGGAVDPRVFERLQATPLGSVERREALLALRGPTWHERFGPDALEPGYRAWRTDAVQRAARAGRTLASPERSNLDVLVPAWRFGLTTIVLLPCRGDVAWRVGEHGLAMTEATRSDTESYRRAVRLFGASAG